MRAKTESEVLKNVKARVADAHGVKETATDIENNLEKKLRMHKLTRFLLLTLCIFIYKR
jgi:predicted small metal-binding protein